jgi:hypothetical protein
MRWHAELQSVGCFLRLLGVLGDWSSSLNRQDAKDAKVGFAELCQRCTTHHAPVLDVLDIYRVPKGFVAFYPQITRISRIRNSMIF